MCGLLEQVASVWFNTSCSCSATSDCLETSSWSSSLSRWRLQELDHHEHDQGIDEDEEDDQADVAMNCLPLVMPPPVPEGLRFSMPALIIRAFGFVRHRLGWSSSAPSPFQPAGQGCRTFRADAQDGVGRMQRATIHRDADRRVLDRMTASAAAGCRFSHGAYSNEIDWPGWNAVCDRQVFMDIGCLSAIGSAVPARQRGSLNGRDGSRLRTDSTGR